jgi:hydroxymethylpyrimidine/phosphomethylpyrimidine kinase
LTNLDGGDDAPVRIVVVGGVDPGGGAGLLRDVATAAERGAMAHAVGTAWTEQGEGVHRVEPRDPNAVRQALVEALATRPVAVKIGMAVEPATAAGILDALAGYAGPVVLDPVLASSRGGWLWHAEPAALLPLARRATLVTPTAGAAAALGQGPVSTAAEAEAAALRLVAAEGLAAVLIKGGHLAPSGGEVTDVLATPGGVQRFVHPRAPGASPRGTGCALATAVAIELGRGHALAVAIAEATAWLGGAIARAKDVGGERRL